MRPFASIVWIAVLLFSTSLSGVWPPHTVLSLEHLTGSMSTALAAPVNAAPANQGSPYAGYGPGYGPVPACQINPSLLPIGWPTTAPAPFTSTFSQFLANTVHVAPNSAPVPITITQEAPTNISPRAITGLPYQLLYNQQYPGPTVRVVSQQTDDSTLTLGSDTSTAPPPLTQLAVTNGVVGSPNNTMVPFPYFTTHLHGGHTAPDHDGHPDDLNPPMPMMALGTGSGSPAAVPPPPHIYSYTNDQQPQILWYHDHADMNTSPHVSAGLYAFYIIEEAPTDPSYPYLPREPYDIPIGMQVMQAGTQPVPVTTNPPNQTMPNYLVAVNGLDSPKLDVESRFYRFRLLNASAGQSISLELCGGAGQSLNSKVWIIGTDGGMLAQPVNLTQHQVGLFQDGRLDVFQAERYDILIDFTGMEGQQVYLSSIVRGPNGCMGSFTTVSPATPQNPLSCIDQEAPMMMFNVGPSYGTDPTDITKIGNRSWDADTAFLQKNHANPNGSFNSTPDRQFTFDRNQNQFVINNQPYDMFRLTNGNKVDAQGNVTPYPQVIHPTQINANTVDMWELVNTVPCAAHPVHVHDIEFQNVTINGNLLSPTQVAQFGWKDIFVLPPMYDPVNCPWVPMNTSPSISFMGYYESHWIQSVPPPTPQVGDTIPWLQTGSDGSWTALTSGTYVYHCHNLGHEDNVMMGQFQVLPPPFTVPASSSMPTPSDGSAQRGMRGHGGG